MNYWLIKSEADCYSIDEFKKDKKTAWTGIRNYLARNFMRDHMKVGDGVLFYHSGKEPAVVGLAKVGSMPHPDETQFNAKNEYFDPKATKEKPIWMTVDMQFIKKFDRPVTLAEIKIRPDLKGIPLIQRGNRLSVQPISKEGFATISALGNKA